LEGPPELGIICIKPAKTINNRDINQSSAMNVTGLQVGE